MPLGRGALTLGLSQPLPGEHIAVPLLCLSGVVAGPRGETGAAGGRILVSLDLQAAQAAPGWCMLVGRYCGLTLLLHVLALHPISHLDSFAVEYLEVSAIDSTHR